MSILSHISFCRCQRIYVLCLRKFVRIVETTEYKGAYVVWTLAENERSTWPKNIYNWVPAERKKKGRPKRIYF
jgi:hypothetical protein